eukprot:COSAG04_NODE_21742_length_368_cov_0.992565_1_plen_60_part_10
MPFHANNAIILPRQARDKHRESSTQKKRPFFLRLRGTLRPSAAAAAARAVGGAALRAARS